jgi:two-component system, cell cycle response regulator
MKQKVLSKLIAVMLLIGICLVIIESYNFRTYGIEVAINKAKSIAEVVRNGLTSYMVNGTMKYRDTYIKSVSDMQNVEKLWIIRGDNVSKQYGNPSKLEIPRDAIDKKVLESSKLQYKIYESFEKTSIRITIPYNAEQNSIANCVSCHDVKYGETLGAISIIMDISEFRTSGLQLAFSIILFTFLAILLVSYFANKILTPHLETIDELSGKIKNISNGTFTNIVKKTGLAKESENLINEYNTLVNGLSTTFSDIDQKLTIFIGDIADHSSNPLLNAQRIIKNLSEIYQFKKEIEVDNTKEEIFERLGQILTNKFGITKFSFMEQNYTSNKTEIVYQKGDCNYCIHHIQNDPDLCRVVRSTSDVSSVQDHRVCQYFDDTKHLHYCTSIDVGDQSIIIINFILDNERELNHLKENIPLIKNYFMEAVPSLIVKYLLNALKVSVFKDGLTGLYNRKFLDEHLSKLVPQALREKISIGVLMLDMDHFKAVNDEYGHDAGDIVLKELGRILTTNVRESDIVIRYGGEEFVVLLVGVNGEKAAIEVANKLRQQVASNEINIYAGNILQKTISIGLSMFPEDSNNFDIVMKNADIALYEAKSLGRNKVVRWQDKVNIELF